VLSQEDAALARQFLAFLEHVDAKAFAATARMNGTEAAETRNMSSEYADYAIKVARGPVVEKIGRTRTITKKPTREFERPNLWSRYYLLDIHPKSPLVGMLHAAIVVQFYDDGTSTIAGFVDVLETANRDADLAFIRQAMDRVFARHGVDPGPHRRLSKKGHDEDDPLSVDNSKRRRTTMVGGSFYGYPLREVNNANLAFMTEAYEAMLDAYFAVVAKRADDPYTDADLLAQDRMRQNWLEDRFFSDPYTTSVTPYDAWSLYSLPPNVKF
jgi:coproporphyrinogen III oxidase